MLGLVAMLALWTALPAGEAGRRPDLRRELAVLKSPVVLVALLTTVLGAGAMFTLYTYVAPTLAELTGASPGFVTAMLVLIGIGFTIGNTAGGRYADRSLDGSLIAFLVLVIADMLAFPWLASAGRRGRGPVDLRLRHLRRGAAAADARDARRHRGTGTGLVGERGRLQPGQCAGAAWPAAR